LLKQDREKESRALLTRALQCLEKRKHLETISKFAQIEYKFGKPEIGRTMFEDLISSYPKRLNIWTVFIDQEEKAGNISNVRDLYARAVCLNFSTKKMKFLFKRFLEFEQDHGDDKSIQGVKDKAIAYIENKK